MIIFRAFACCTLLLLALLIAGAQPGPDDCSLSVRVVTAEGKPFPVGPTVITYRLEGNNRVYSGRNLTSKENVTAVILLVPGRYEVSITLPTYGLVDGPRTIELLPGVNEIEWRVPAIIPVGGDLLAADKPALTPKQTQVYLLSNVRYGPNLAVGSFSPGHYALTGAFPGSYKMLMMTENSYGYTSFQVPKDQHGAVSTPVNLFPGGALTFDVTYDTDTHAKNPLYYCYLVVSGQVEKTFPLTLVLYSDQAGKAHTLTLPPGTWKWSARHQSYPTQTGTVTIAPGKNQTIEVDMTAGQQMVPK